MVDTPAIEVSIDSPPYQTIGDLIQNTIEFGNDINSIIVINYFEALQIGTFVFAFITDSARRKDKTACHKIMTTKSKQNQVEDVNAITDINALLDSLDNEVIETSIETIAVTRGYKCVNFALTLADNINAIVVKRDKDGKVIEPIQYDIIQTNRVVFSEYQLGYIFSMSECNADISSYYETLKQIKYSGLSFAIFTVANLAFLKGANITLDRERYFEGDEYETNGEIQTVKYHGYNDMIIKINLPEDNKKALRKALKAAIKDANNFDVDED